MQHSAARDGQETVQTPPGDRPSGCPPRARLGEVLVLGPAGAAGSGIAIAASRADACGLLDWTCAPEAVSADDECLAPLVTETRRLGAQAGERFGLVLWGRLGIVESAALAAIDRCHTLLLVPTTDRHELAEAYARARLIASRVGLVVADSAQAAWAAELGADLVVAKGHEAGGFVADETTFVLVQRLLAWGRLPVIAWGGIGVRSAAAVSVGGAAGVALDWPLALLGESALPPGFRKRLASMDGSETVAVRGPDGRWLRFYHQPGMTALERLERLADELATADQAPGEKLRAWRQVVGELASRAGEKDRLWTTGQDACFAAGWAQRCPSVGRFLRLFREQTDQALADCRASRVLAAGSELAQSHGTEFPVVQGPMTRVSDVASFARAVADGGGLPFLALALMSGGQARQLLSETKQLLGQLPWGVGVLGFVGRELRAEQFAAIEEVAPPFAIIAGGRPDQAQSLEARGIKTYLHVPSPGMLSMFLAEGARRFIFEGRECGGHVGPRSSLVLWETMIQVLLDAPLDEAQARGVHVLFAGGIHDGLGAAMVAALAQPLVARGMKVGVLLGTAYLFTREIVETGAILEGFQQQALATERTVLLETGPGHATRCAATHFYDVFEEEKRSLRRQQLPAEQVREELENLNLGRLRIASKGITRRTSESSGQSELVHVEAAEQAREGMFMIGQVAALRHEPTTVRQLHQQVCGGATERLAQLAPRPEPERFELVSEPAPPPLDIAVIGMSCLLPGAHDLTQYWHNILANRDLLTEIPQDRYEWQRWWNEDRKARDKIYSRWGGFLDDVAFDPLKYGIPPSALKSIEPIQLLALELVDRALRDSGYDAHNPHKDRTAVMFGAGGGIAELGAGYAVRSMLPQYLENPDERLWSQLPEWTEDSFAGILMNVIAGRVSNRFDLGGVNYTVDAACASSLAAIYLACRELADGTADLCITGGVDTLQSPFSYLCFGTAGALSPRGKSRTFDASSDGIAISEGLAAVVLKRRADAERDGDRIYAVIRGVAGASDGRSKGMTAPRHEGQVRTLLRAYRQARFSPASVDHFEAHGTGTSVGDMTECLSLTRALELAGAGPENSAIGSVKSQIGHTKCTAGVAGLIKSALALYYRVLPPTLHVEQPNPKGRLVDGPLYVNSQVRPWIAGPQPRRAGVSSFGFGGTNFHTVLEEYTGEPAPAQARMARREMGAELLLFAANAPAGLLQKVRSLADPLARAVAAGHELSLADLAATWHRRQSTAPEGPRAAVVATSVDGLREQLTALIAHLSAPGGNGNLPAGVSYRAQPLATGQRVALLFPGQGSQFPNMLRDLAVQFREVADVFSLADSVLAGAWSKPLSRHVFPVPAFNPQQQRSQVEALKATDVLQPALGACGLALLRLLEGLGVRATMAAGHSYGELVALAAAGSLSPESLLRLSLARGRSIVELVSSGQQKELGQMLAIAAPGPEVADALAGLPEVWLANLNSPRQTIVSGTASGLAGVRQRLDERKLAATPLPVACAFHSPLVAAAGARFAEALSQTEFRAPRWEVFGNTTADAYPDDPAVIRRRLTEHLTSQVRFVEQIEAMYAAGARVFVELGPKGVLSKLTREILGDRPHLAVPLQPSETDGVRQLLGGLAELFVAGVPLDPERLYQGRELATLDLAALAQPKAPPAKHLWLINGGYARPIHQPKRTMPRRVRLVGEGEVAVSGSAPAPAAAPAISASAGPSMAPAASPVAAPQAPAVASLPLAPVPAQVPAVSAAAVPIPSAPSAVSGDALVDFQETMRYFLAMQEAVMTSYFQGAPAAAAPAGTVIPVAAPAAAAPPIAVASVPAPQGVVAPAGPPQVVPAAAQTPPALPPVAVVVSSPAGTEPAADRAMADENSSQPALAPALSRQGLGDLLVNIVSERTGYPSDMLEMSANLEADLGIDSIKRVEIVGAFRRAALPELQEPPAWFMEKVTGVTTLRQIVDTVAELAGATQAGTDAATPPPSTAATAEVATVREEALEELLMNVVSERTGYPADMLALDANLEADLGIDSIKRVEIVGAFRRAALPELDDPPSWFMEEMSGAGTMRAILSGVTRLGHELSGTSPAAAAVAPVHADQHHSQGQASPNGEAAVRANAPVGKPLADDCPRCVAAVVEVPWSKVPAASLAAGTLLLTDDQTGLAGALVAALSAQGRSAVVLPESALLSPEAARAQLEELRRTRGPLAGLIHLAPLAPVAAYPGVAAAAWQSAYEREVRSLLGLLQALAPELAASADGAMAVLSVTLGGGDFRLEPNLEASRPWRGGVTGVLKVAAKEWTGARFRAIDTTQPPDPGALIRELSLGGPVEIGYRGTRRFTIEPMRRDLPEVPPGADLAGLTAESVVLVTGGARGITAEVAEALAAHVPLRLVLMGRTPLIETSDAELDAAGDAGALRALLIARLKAAGQSVTPRDVERQVASHLAQREVRESLARISAAGAQVEYVACDVRDSLALASAVREIRDRCGRIDGLIHGAGVIEDRYLVDKSVESFDRVVNTKVDSLLALLSLIEPAELKMLVLFSSVSGFFGNPGQADYAAANETLNRLAARLGRLLPARVVAINWGPWEGTGMVTPEVARQFAARGVGMVPVARGRRAVLAELASEETGDPCVLCGPGPWVEGAERLADEASRVDVPTPLLAGQRVTLPEPGLLEAEVCLDSAKHPYLNEHRIDDHPVLPLCFATELMVEAAAAAAPPDWHVVRVENVRAFAGVVLQQAKRELVVRAEPLERSAEGGRWRVQILDPQRNRRPHYDCMVVLASRRPAPPAVPALERIAERFPLGSVGEAYSRWLFHGPLFQAITELRGLDASGIDAVFRPSDPEATIGRGDTTGWLIDPVVLDACPQLAMLWSRARFDTSPLPNRVGAFHRFGPIGDGPLEAVFRVEPGTDESAYKATVWLIRGGRVVGIMEGLEGAGTAALNRITGSSS